MGCHFVSQVVRLCLNMARTKATAVAARGRGRGRGRVGRGRKKRISKPKDKPQGQGRDRRTRGQVKKKKGKEEPNPFESPPPPGQLSMSAGLVVGGPARSANPKRKASAKVLARPAAKRVKRPKKRHDNDGDNEEQNEKVSGDDASKVGASAAAATSSSSSSSSSTSNDDEDDHDAKKDAHSDTDENDEKPGPSSISGPAPVNCTLKADDSESDDDLDGELHTTVQAGATRSLKNVFQHHFHTIDRIHQCFGTETLQNMSKNVGNLRVASLYSGLGGYLPDCWTSWTWPIWWQSDRQAFGIFHCMLLHDMTDSTPYWLDNLMYLKILWRTVQEQNWAVHWCTKRWRRRLLLLPHDIQYQFLHATWSRIADKFWKVTR